MPVLADLGMLLLEGAPSQGLQLMLNLQELLAERAVAQACCFCCCR